MSADVVRVGELGPQLTQLLVLGLDVPVQVSRPGQHVLEGQQPQRGRRVLHGQQVLQLPFQALVDQAAAARLLRVQQRRDDPVPQVVVGLPVPGVVLVVPRHVPGGDARHGHGRVAVLLGPHPVLRVIPLDEDRQRQPDLPDDLGRDQAHPPAVVVRVGAAVHPGRVPQVPAGEVVPSPGVRRDPPPPLVRGDGLGERVQQGPVVEAEHVAADDGRPPGQVGEGGGPPDALRVHLDVVIEQQQVVALPGRHRLVHGPGEAAGAADVALLDDLQPVGQLLGRVAEAGCWGGYSPCCCPGRSRTPCRAGRPARPRHPACVPGRAGSRAG